MQPVRNVLTVIELVRALGDDPPGNRQVLPDELGCAQAEDDAAVVVGGRTEAAQHLCLQRPRVRRRQGRLP